MIDYSIEAPNPDMDDTLARQTERGMSGIRKFQTLIDEMMTKLRGDQDDA